MCSKKKSRNALASTSFFIDLLNLRKEKSLANDSSPSRLFRFNLLKLIGSEAGGCLGGRWQLEKLGRVRVTRRKNDQKCFEEVFATKLLDQLSRRLIYWSLKGLFRRTKLVEIASHCVAF